MSDTGRVQFIIHFENGEINSARKTLITMEGMDPEHTSVRQRRDLLDTQQGVAVVNAIKSGKRFYTEGMFAQAIDVWKEALKLDPGNKELKNNISRAEKFQGNLDRLKKQ